MLSHAGVEGAAARGRRAGGEDRQGARQRCPSSSTSSCSPARPRARSRSPTCARAAPRTATRSPASAPRRSRPRTRRRSSTPPARPGRPRAACSRTRTCSTRPTPTSTGSSCAAQPPVMFQYLPLAHVLARMVAFVAIEAGGVLAFCSGDTKKLAEEIEEAQPDAHPDRPAPAGEDPHARGRPGGRRGRRQGRDLHARAGHGREGGQGQARGPQGQPDRQGPPRGRRQARAEQGPRRARHRQPGPDHRRGADRHRGDRVLLRLRRARCSRATG